MKEWVEYKLGDLCVKVTSGGTPLTSKKEYYENGNIPWLKTTEIHKEVIRQTDTYITEEGLRNSSAKLIPANSIIVAMYGDGGTAGKVALTKIDLTTNQACCNLTIDENKADYSFVYYYLKINYENLVNLKTGGSQQNLNALTIKNFPILIPKIFTQRRIASILSAYDDLIEVNNQRIKLLEETARELYKEWFVRMRFPGYKKAKFVKGIPEGWEIKRIIDFGKVFTGKTPSTKIREYYGGEIPFIKTPDLHKTFFVFNTEETLTEKGSNTQKKSILPPNSICVSCIGTGGIVSITTAEKSQTNQQINSLVLSDVSNLEFLFFRITDLKETIELFGGTGATMTNLSKGKFENLKLLFPETMLVKNYHKVVNPMFLQIKSLQQQSNQLRQIRYRLLPRLISGKLKVNLSKEYEINEQLSMAAEP